MFLCRAYAEIREVLSLYSKTLSYHATTSGVYPLLLMSWKSLSAIATSPFCAYAEMSTVLQVRWCIEKLPSNNIGLESFTLHVLKLLKNFLCIPTPLKGRNKRVPFW